MEKYINEALISINSSNYQIVKDIIDLSKQNPTVALRILRKDLLKEVQSIEDTLTELRILNKLGVIEISKIQNHEDELLSRLSIIETKARSYKILKRAIDIKEICEENL